MKEIKCFFCGLEIDLNNVVGIEYESMDGRKFENVHKDPLMCVYVLKERLKKYES